MATWIAHLRIADQLLPLLPGIDKIAFLVGSIGPDCGKPSDDWMSFDPPPSVTHWTKTGIKRDIDAEAFYQAYLKNDCGQTAFAFYFGYYLHLVSDVLWTTLVALPNAAIYQANYDADDHFIFEVKKDWYDQDHLFLKRNPKFEPFQILQSIEKFENRYLPYYPEDAFITQIQYITEFYRKGSDTLNREFPYLKESEMNDFIEASVAQLKALVKEKAQDVPSSVFPII